MKDICDKKMKFEDCELAILRTAVDNADEKGRAEPRRHAARGDLVPREPLEGGERRRQVHAHALAAGFQRAAD